MPPAVDSLGLGVDNDALEHHTPHMDNATRTGENVDMTRARSEYTHPAGEPFMRLNSFPATVIKHVALLCEQDDRLDFWFLGRGRTGISIIAVVDMPQSELDEVQATLAAVEERYDSPERREMTAEVKGMFVHPSSTSA